MDYIQKSDESRAAIAKSLARLEIAMFANDDQNENRSIGVMTMCQRVVTHIDTVCSLAVALAKTVKIIGGAVIGLGALLASAKSMGWW